MLEAVSGGGSGPSRPTPPEIKMMSLFDRCVMEIKTMSLVINHIDGSRPSGSEGPAQTAF